VNIQQFILDQINNEKIFVFIFATGLGILARSVYESLVGKVQKGSLIQRLILASFINFILHPVILNYKWMSGCYPQVIALGAFLSIQIATWLDKKLLNKIINKFK